MRRLFWVLAWVGVAFWSPFALAAYGIVNVAGSAAMRNADMLSSDPETVEWIFRVMGWVHSLSTSVVLVVWGVVSLAILAVPWFLDRMAGAVIQHPAHVGRAPERGVIDLAPDQYSVDARPTDGQPNGPLPRLPSGRRN